MRWHKLTQQFLDAEHPLIIEQDAAKEAERQKIRNHVVQCIRNDVKRGRL